MGVSKSAASRRFVALSAGRLADFMAADLSALDLLVAQIDGLHLGDDLVLVAAIGVDGEVNKHPLPLVEGATENAATVRALLDNLVSRGLDPTVPRLLSVVEGDPPHLRFGRRDPALPDLQGAQHHGTPAERASCGHPSGAAPTWELDDAEKAEKLIRNLARRVDRQWLGVAVSILAGLDEILTVVRLKLPKELRPSLACTNITENMMGTIRRVTRNVKRWRDAGMALRWVTAGDRGQQGRPTIEGA
ncbi:hypothetical protein ACVWYH_005434 [Bradyrhizobium sp. GM24.11]